MKLSYLLAALTVLLCSACNNSKPIKKEIVLGDTIQTKSGLQYYYIKIGEGPKVKMGSKVATYLSLKVDDKVIWNTDDLPDSAFTFVADYSKLIKGFTEMTMLLREGDEVLAILPDSLAYGAKGAGDIVPPHATLVYDQFKVLKVDAPKAFLSDVLLADIKEKTVADAIKSYQQIISSADSLKYHTDREQLFRVWETLNTESLHQPAADYALQFGKMCKEPRLEYKAVLSLESLGELSKAKEQLERIISLDPDNPQMKKKLEELSAN